MAPPKRAPDAATQLGWPTVASASRATNVERMSWRGLGALLVLLVVGGVAAGLRLAGGRSATRSRSPSTGRRRCPRSRRPSRSTRRASRADGHRPTPARARPRLPAEHVGGEPFALGCRRPGRLGAAPTASLGEWPWFGPGQPLNSGFTCGSKLVDRAQVDQATMAAALNARHERRLERRDRAVRPRVERPTDYVRCATYISDDHRRLNDFQRFIRRRARTTPTPTIAVVGRIDGREGLARTCFERVATERRGPLTGVRGRGSRPCRSTRLAVARSALRTCTHSSRLAATCTTRSTVTPSSGQSV